MKETRVAVYFQTSDIGPPTSGPPLGMRFCRFPLEKSIWRLMLLIKIMLAKAGIIR